VGWPRTEAAVTSVAAAAATSSGTPRSASAAADAAGADAPAPALAGRAALVGVPAGVPSRVRLVGVLAALPPAPPPLVLRSDGPACGRCASRPSAEGGCLVGLRASASCGAFAALQAVRGAAAFWKGAGAGALTPRAPRAWPGRRARLAAAPRILGCEQPGWWVTCEWRGSSSIARTSHGNPWRSLRRPISWQRIGAALREHAWFSSGDPRGLAGDAPAALCGDPADAGAQAATRSGYRLLPRCQASASSTCARASASYRGRVG